MGNKNKIHGEKAKLARLKSLNRDQARALYLRYYKQGADFKELSLQDITDKFSALSGTPYAIENIHWYFTVIFNTLLEGVAFEGDKWETVKELYGDIIEKELQNEEDLQKFPSRRKKKPRTTVIIDEGVIEEPPVENLEEDLEDKLEEENQKDIPEEKLGEEDQALVIRGSPKIRDEDTESKSELEGEKPKADLEELPIENKDQEVTEDQVETEESNIRDIKPGEEGTGAGGPVVGSTRSEEDRLHPALQSDRERKRSPRRRLIIAALVVIAICSVLLYGGYAFCDRFPDICSLTGVRGLRATPTSEVALAPRITQTETPEPIKSPPSASEQPTLPLRIPGQPGPTKILVNSPTPTFTLMPTSTTTPTQTSPPPNTVLFEDDFNNNLSKEWQYEAGSYSTTQDGWLIASRPTWLLVGDPSWKNIQIEFDAITPRGSSCNTNPNEPDILGVRVQDLDNMAAFKWNSCNYWWFVVDGGRWYLPADLTIMGGTNPNGSFKMVITVQGDELAAYQDNVHKDKSIAHFDKVQAGRIALMLDSTTKIDNFRVTSLP
jgi:hypothetical protein